jgi:hypothetical protein
MTTANETANQGERRVRVAVVGAGYWGPNLFGK